MPVIWGRDQAKYFFGRDWTTQIRLKRLRKLVFWRRAPHPPNRSALAYLLLEFRWDSDWNARLRLQQADHAE